MSPRRSRVPARGLLSVALASLTCLLLIACTNGGPRGPADIRAQRAGGTLEITVPPGDLRPRSAGASFTTLDPGLDYSGTGMALLRCCLVRTLMSFDDRPGHDGELVPDLASGPPTVSSDGLTWTFLLRPGLRYAPPLDSTTITSSDVERALVRAASVGTPYSFYYSVIEGFDAAASGGLASISGLETPSDRTLRIHLTQPTGDLGYRLALPAAAPLPQLPDGTATLGIATGHDTDFADYLVASGPYMYVDAPNERLTSVPPFPAVELNGASSITLVRDPSWDPGTDPIRPAYVDRIHIVIGGDVSSNAEKVERGLVDLQLSESTPTPSSTLARYESDPTLSRRIVTWDENSVSFVTMDLALPPFDDVNVRRAVAYAMNTRELVRQTRAVPYAPSSNLTGRLARHIAPDATEQNLLAGFDPFPGRSGDERRAHAFAAMERSAYDTNGDGKCDLDACGRVRLLVYDEPPFPSIGETIRKDLHPIGIEVTVELARWRYGHIATDPAAHTGMVLLAWTADYPSPSTFFLPLLSGEAITNTFTRNTSLLGASPAQLRRFGYPTSRVPSIDDRIAQCTALADVEQVSCWALLDKYVMTRIVPWVPYFTDTYVAVGSERTHGLFPDAMSSLPALEQIWLDPTTPPASGS